MVAVLSAALGRAPSAPAQTVAQGKFEIVSIKPTPPPTAVAGGRTGGLGSPAHTCLASVPRAQLQLSPTRFAVSRVSVHALIAAAYGVDCSLPEAIGTEPDWAKSEAFEIQAVIPSGDYNFTRHGVVEGNEPLFQRMLQNMLSDRFRLQLKQETKEVAGYQLVATKTAI